MEEKNSIIIDKFVDIWWRLRIVKGMAEDNEPEDLYVYEGLVKFWKKVYGR